MKKGAKVTFLVMALLWFVLQMYQFINNIIINSSVANLYSSSKGYSLMVLCFDNIPTLFFAATIITVFIADLAHKTLKHEKIIYGISMVLFLAYIVIVSIGQYNSLMSNPQNTGATIFNKYYLYIENLIALLIFVFIAVYLIFITFNVRFKKLILVLYSTSVLLYMAMEIIKLLTPTDQYVINPFNVIQVIVVMNIVFLAIFGFMLRDVKNTGKTTEPVLDKPLVSQ